MVITEGWIPPSFSIPDEIFEENLMALVRRLDLSKEEQYEGVVKPSSIDALKQTAVQQHIPLSSVDFNHHEIPDKTVADCVESLIGAHLQVITKTNIINFLFVNYFFYFFASSSNTFMFGLL